MFFCVFTAVMLFTSAIYSAMPMESQIGNVLSWALLPGVALYSSLNNSLLFGPGFGTVGSFAVIVLGATATWTVLVFTLLALVARRDMSLEQ